MAVTRREALLGAGAALVAGLKHGSAATRLPNIILIFADDMGYGDLGCYGSKIKTPHLDQLAREGVRFTDFYAASPVCSPSRAALLTGRYGVRVGVPSVLSTGDKVGMNANEVTIAEMLKPLNYQTMCIGKWHLGTQPSSMPTGRGFDGYYGIPFSHDMWPRPLMVNNTVIEQPAKIDTLTQRYTQQAISFIRSAAAGPNPFFLYLAHSMPHIPLAASPDFKGASKLGPYADSVMEIDWSTGELMATLREAQLDSNTLVLFSSDNGPWYQGSPGRLRGRKGDTWEGGMREPFIARMPGRIPHGLVATEMASTLDFLPTIAGLTGAALPAKPLDGTDIWPLISGSRTQIDHPPLFYFNYWDLQCARLGDWKLHVSRYNAPLYQPVPGTGRVNLPLPSPELYDLAEDPEESFDLAGENPDVVNDLMRRMQESIAGFPLQVQGCWGDTLKRKVEDTPSGALPVEILPPPA